MFKGNLKLKVKKRNLNTPNIIHNKNIQMFVDKKAIINNNRPFSKNIFGHKGMNNKDKIIQINNNNNKGNKQKNFNNNIKVNNHINVNNLNFNIQRNIIPNKDDKKRIISDFNSEDKQKVKRIYLANKINSKQRKKEEKKNVNNNIIEQLSKSLKKNNYGNYNNIPFSDKIEDDSKNMNNKIFFQNNIKRINVKNNENDINRILPILKSNFDEEDNFRPDNMGNQINIFNNQKDFGIKKHLRIVPLNENKNQMFMNKNKKKIILNNHKKQINNLFNINININNNFDNNNRYLMNNNLKENNNIILRNRKNNNNHRQNNFLINHNNKDDNKFIIKKSIDFYRNKNINGNNIIINKVVSSSEEPINVKHNKLRLAKNNNNERKNVNNINIINPNNNEKNIKIIDYFCKENKNSQFNDNMEDYTLIKHPFFSKGKNNLSLFAVFDGHGGAQIAEFLKNNFSEHLLKTITSDYTLRFTEILKNAIITIDKNIENLENSQKCGSTGTFIIVNNNNIYCANIGDSKCFYINDKEAIQLTEDHNCKNDKEVELLKSKGVMIFRRRVFGSLFLTRSFGDMEFKKEGLTAIPFITKINSDKSNVKYVIIASDGIWDVVDDKQLFTLSKELKNGTSEEFCNNLVNYAMEKGSNDNISCIIIRFGNQ